MLALLKRLLPHKEMGWAEHGEEFTRFQLLRTPWFQLLLHRFNAPRWHPECHDHPWWFVSLILAGGYLERDAGGDINWRPPGASSGTRPTTRTTS